MAPLESAVNNFVVNLYLLLELTYLRQSPDCIPSTCDHTEKQGDRCRVQEKGYPQHLGDAVNAIRWTEAVGLDRGKPWRGRVVAQEFQHPSRIKGTVAQLARPLRKDGDCSSGLWTL